MYKAISLFSGAMGLDLGIEKAGFSIAVCVELNKTAAATIKKNTSIPVINKDINKVSTQEILKTAGINKEDVTLVFGGPPCQAFSTAGKQKGFADFRGNVIIQFLRIVQEIRPTYFILENVRGILSAKINNLPPEYSEYDNIKNIKGSVLFFLTSEFRKLGYNVSHALLNSANYGVPEKRERIFIIGHLGDRVPIPSPTHSENGDFNTLKWTTLYDAIGDLENRDDLKFIPLRKNITPFMEIIKEGENWRNLPEELAIKAMGKAYYLSGGKTGFLRRLSYNKPSPTLVTSPTMPATQLCHPKKLRPLSIEEYARIQQFPDNWIFEGKIEEIYKQIGNAVPVGLAFAIGNQVMLHIKGKTHVWEESYNKIPYSRYKNTTDYTFGVLFEDKVTYNSKNNMENLITKVEKYVKDNISSFHDNRIEKLKELKLNKLLKRKNPYLYKAMDLNTPEKVVRALASAFISSTEETMFGNWLEGLAIFIAQITYNGRKSNAEGIDLEMEKGGIHYIVSIKSGPNWSNSSSMNKQIQNFQKAIRVYRTSGNKKQCVAIEGCCYGNANAIKDSHERLCGQSFWEFISGNQNLYIDIIEPLGIDAKKRNEIYNKEFDKMITKFTKEFSDNYCDYNGNINWNKIVQLNSANK